MKFQNALIFAAAAFFAYAKAQDVDASANTNVEPTAQAPATQPEATQDQVPATQPEVTQDQVPVNEEANPDIGSDVEQANPDLGSDVEQVSSDNVSNDGQVNPENGSDVEPEGEDSDYDVRYPKNAAGNYYSVQKSSADPVPTDDPYADDYEMPSQSPDVGSDVEDDGSVNAAALAAGIAGTTVAAAGLFVWAKKSKKQGLEAVDSLRTQFTLA